MAIVATGIAMSGCKKKEDKLEIHVNTPAKNAEYTSPVPVSVHITGGELIIHDVEIKVFEKANPANQIFDYDNHVEVSDYTVTDQIQVNVTAPTVYTLKANVGEDDHTAEYTHDFTIKP